MHTGRTYGRITIMWKDSIVEDVRKVREEHAAKFNYNLDAIYQDLKKQEKRSGRKVVSLPAKQVVVTAKKNHLKLRTPNHLLLMNAHQMTLFLLKSLWKTG